AEGNDPPRLAVQQALQDAPDHPGKPRGYRPKRGADEDPAQHARFVLGRWLIGCQQSIAVHGSQGVNEGARHFASAMPSPSLGCKCLQYMLFRGTALFAWHRAGMRFARTARANRTAER